MVTGSLSSLEQATHLATNRHRLTPKSYTVNIVVVLAIYFKECTITTRQLFFNHGRQPFCPGSRFTSYFSELLISAVAPHPLSAYTLTSGLVKFTCTPNAENLLWRVLPALFRGSKGCNVPALPLCLFLYLLPLVRLLFLVHQTSFQVSTNCNHYNTIQQWGRPYEQTQKLSQ